MLVVPIIYMKLPFSQEIGQFSVIHSMQCKALIFGFEIARID